METPSSFNNRPGVSLEQALAEIGNAVYQATGPAEDLEHQGKLHGNGHHLRQQMALRVQMLLYEQWADQDEKSRLDPSHPVKEAAQTNQEK